ncbi:7974_t:CDS:2, partial [Dentiscutata heterogama]
CFKDATLEISALTYPTLSYTISIYNYLLDLIKKFLNEDSYSNDIINKTKYMLILNQNNNQVTNKPSRLMAYIVKKRKYTELDELIKYLQKSPSNCNIDILTFWKLHEKDYLNLSKMARDFLAIL